MGEAATELDRYLADAPQEVKDEYQRRLNEAAEEAAKPYKELQDAIFGLADEYSRQELLIHERKLLCGVFRSCAVQATYFQGF